MVELDFSLFLKGRVIVEELGIGRVMRRGFWFRFGVGGFFSVYW